MNRDRSIAVFDLDGTITFKDTFVEFIRYTHGSMGLYFGFLANFGYLVLYLLKIYPNDKFKEKMFSHFFKEHDQESLFKKGEAFSREVLPRVCYAAAIKKLQWHRAQEHHIVILTASSPIWLQQWCKDNNYRLIGTEFSVENGRFSGSIKGRNCWGPEKVRRLQEEIDLSDYEYSYGYGDRKSDLHFLNMLDRSHFGPLR